MPNKPILKITIRCPKCKKPLYLVREFVTGYRFKIKSEDKSDRAVFCCKNESCLAMQQGRYFSFDNLTTYEYAATNE